MAHCGYEPTAVLATARSPREGLRALVGVLGARRRRRTQGGVAPRPPAGTSAMAERS